MMKLIKNGKVLQNGELQQADILIDGKVIEQNCTCNWTKQWC